MTKIPDELKALSPKKRDFVLAYIETKNATLAAKKAGYSAKTAKSQGQRLLTKVDIQKAMAAITEPIVAKQLVTVEEIIKELKDIGMADWREFVEIRHDREGEVVDAKLKLGDKVKALQLLGDHAGAWKDTTVNLKHFNLGALLSKADDE